jgi:hypothetical protein
VAVGTRPYDQRGFCLGKVLFDRTRFTFLLLHRPQARPSNLCGAKQPRIVARFFACLPPSTSPFPHQQKASPATFAQQRELRANALPPPSSHRSTQPSVHPPSLRGPGAQLPGPPLRVMGGMGGLKIVWEVNKVFIFL